MEPRFYRSWHLAKSDTEFKIAEFEWSLIRFYESFTRFVLATGVVTITSNVDLKHQEHIILHVVRMQERPKTSAMIGRLMNRDDIANIQYSLRKLEAAGLVEKQLGTDSKTCCYSASDLGIRLADEYYKVRKEILTRRLEEVSEADEKFERYARFMSLLTGIYDEAARDAATITSQAENAAEAAGSTRRTTKRKAD